MGLWDMPEGRARAVSSGQMLSPVLGIWKIAGQDTVGRSKTVYWPLDCSSTEVALPGSSTPEPGTGQSKDPSIAPHHQLIPVPQVVCKGPGVRAKVLQMLSGDLTEEGDSTLGERMSAAAWDTVDESIPRAWAHSTLVEELKACRMKKTGCSGTGVCLQPTGPFQAGLVSVIVTLAVRPSVAWPGLPGPCCASD